MLFHKPGAVLVTGANGFIGPALCAHLERAGWKVLAAVRQLGDAIPGALDTIQVGTIAESTNWRQWLEGVDHVVHLANVAHVTKAIPAEVYEATNVRATKTLLDACVATRVKRFVYLSSVKAIGDHSGEGRDDVLTEQTPCQPGDAYGRSKLQAEQLVLSNQAVEGTVLRPPLVYGPGVRANFLRLLRAVDRGIPLPLGRVNNRRAMIYRDNLVDAIELCLRHRNAAGDVFLVRDSTELSTRDLVLSLAEQLHRPARLLPVPMSALIWAGKVTGKYEYVRRLVSSLSISTEKVTSELGWRPPYTVTQGLAATTEWYLQARS